MERADDYVKLGEKYVRVLFLKDYASYITDDYYDDIITVFGHTPAMSCDSKYKGKILRTKTWIDVDVGVPYGNSPALLKLDELTEYYL